MATETNQAGGTPETGASGGGTQPGASGQQPQTGAEGGTPESFDAWLAGQDDDAKDWIEEHVKGLKKTLTDERTERKRLEKEIKTLAKGAADGSDLKSKLDELSTKLSEQGERADFYDEAHKRGISNLRLAYLTAKAENLIDGRGRADFDGLKESFPELFQTEKRTQVPPGNAGNGRSTGPPKLSGNAAANQWIRTQAGKT